MAEGGIDVPWGGNYGYPFWSASSSSSSVDGVVSHNSNNVSHCESSAEDLLGTCDSIFMFMYALGLLVFGWLGDQIGHKKLLVIGLSLSGVAVASIGILLF